MKKGAVDFLMKPFSKLELLSAGSAMGGAMNVMDRQWAQDNEEKTFRARYAQLSGREKDVVFCCSSQKGVLLLKRRHKG